MQTEAGKTTATEQNSLVEEKIQKLRELYADAPELGRVALEKGLPDLRRELGAATGAQTAGRIGARQGKVSELTGIIPFAKGGAKRLRGLLQALEGNFRGGDAVGTLHDMRFVFLDNDTKLLFATAYDGEWDAYIDDFVTKIPNSMDLIFWQSRGMARNSQLDGERLHRQSPGRRRGLVRRQSESDGSGDATARAPRQGG